MNTKQNNYCRFCAKPKSTEKLLDLHEDEITRNDINMKLAFVNAIYVDVSNTDLLPKTICLVCYDALCKAYDFLESVKLAQDVLSKLFASEIEKKRDASDDENISNFDDFLDNETSEDNLDTKIQLSETVTEQDCINNDVIEVTVKMEPKEENTDSLAYNETLNVQDIIDAALMVPLSSNMTIYAKEISGNFFPCSFVDSLSSNNYFHVLVGILYLWNTKKHPHDSTILIQALFTLEECNVYGKT